MEKLIEVFVLAILLAIVLPAVLHVAGWLLVAYLVYRLLGHPAGRRSV